MLVGRAFCFGKFNKVWQSLEMRMAVLYKLWVHIQWLNKISGVF
jgi:hypothetical protein